jgi:hypothetical protein
VAPYTFPENGPREYLPAINTTRITVKEQFRYLPSFTSYVFPVGEYVPVRKNANGTFYESPKGILVQATTGSFLVRGGIYRANNETQSYPFSFYVYMPMLGLTQFPLHNMWGLNLNEKIVCTPSHEFK